MSEAPSEAGASPAADPGAVHQAPVAEAVWATRAAWTLMGIATALTALAAWQRDADLGPAARSGWISLALGIAAAAGTIRASLLERRLGNPAPAVRALLRGAALPLVVSLLACSVIGWRSTCDGRASALNALVAIAPSVFVWAAAGAFAIQRCRRVLPATAILALLVVANVAWTFARVTVQPQFFAEDHFGLYSVEERAGLYHLLVPAEGRVVRLVSLAFGALLLLLAIPLKAYRHLFTLFAAVISTVALGAVVIAAELNPAALGTGATIEDIEEALSQRAASAHFDLRYAPGVAEEDARAVLDELEFSLSRLAPVFAPPPDRHYDVYLYGSEELKRRFAQMAWVDFTEMAPRRLHLTDPELPSGTLRHELAHLLSAEWGREPFDQSWRGFLEANAGLMEGLAEALHEPSAESTLHEHAHALRKRGLAPDLRVLMDGEAFEDTPPAVAYALAGSFMKYLLDTYGAEAVRSSFPDGDWARGYGKALEALVSEWERYVDGLPVESARIDALVDLLRPPVDTGHACYREVTALLNEASQREGAQAAPPLQRCVTLAPDAPRCRVELVSALQWAERWGDAREQRAAVDRLVNRASPEYVTHSYVQLWDVIEEPGPAAEDEAQQLLQDILATRPLGPYFLSAWSYTALYEPRFSSARAVIQSEGPADPERAIEAVAMLLGDPPVDPRLPMMMQSISYDHWLTVRSTRWPVSYDAVPAEGLGAVAQWDLGMAWRHRDCERIRRTAEHVRSKSAALDAASADYLARCDWLERAQDRGEVRSEGGAP